jgi:hypothetical protein
LAGPTFSGSHRDRISDHPVDDRPCPMAKGASRRHFSSAAGCGGKSGS